MKKKIIAVTAGHSPRNDIISELDKICNGKYEFIQSGALDGLTKQEVIDIQNNIKGEYFISRGLDGERVKIPRDIAIDRMKKCFNKGFEQEAIAGIVLCTFESFEDLTPAYNKIIIKPHELMINYTKSIAKNKNIGIIYPAAELTNVAIKNWSRVSTNVIVKDYRSNETMEKYLFTVNELIAGGVELIILDCISYTIEMKNIIKNKYKTPVIFPKTMIIQALDELF